MEGRYNYQPESVKQVDKALIYIITTLVLVVGVLAYVFNQPAPNYKVLAEKRTKELLPGFKVLSTECVGDYCISIAKYEDSVYAVTNNFPEVKIQKL